MVKIILNLYAPQYFTIKSKSDMKHGAQHYFNAVLLARKCLQKTKFISKKDTKKTSEWLIVLNVLKRNAFFCTSEAIIYSMVCDENLDIRRKGVKIIKKIRSQNKKKSKVPRTLTLPKAFIRFDAPNYHSLLNFQTLKKQLLTEPPMMFGITNEALDDHADGEKGM